MNSKANTVAFANPPFFLGHPVELEYNTSSMVEHRK